MESPVESQSSVLSSFNEFSPTPRCSQDVPASLKRHGTSYVTWEHPTAAEFLEWWKKTPTYWEFLQKGTADSFRWDSAKHSGAWSHYNQVARIADGRVSVACVHCSAVLKHPSVRNTGTSSLRSHLATGSCTGKRKASTIDVHIVTV